ncbi:hypothetical protein Gobs01_00827 [Geodermatophilus obscurus DSM 43160]|uniref:Primosomal protein n=1 Tax=Geodermatophilus obscurus (strain ATCC 25078 / DSM 43160 / JCM 3152 / CCUG 61914 / KCC A-0152 / KCTC 9177 / NBRC 13315 / NRRL B-3577 / G-20) TaxID=526225 RepID=D2SG80_GEOOG|nr:conserved hypothetical protein [Geodermatophilus obscurus DSM 43160]
MARPSIVPIALTVDDRTGFTLWAPPWEEDGEEWQAFLGTSEDDRARVHLFPTPAALAAFCRTRTDHDLADHPVWPVVVGLGAADLTPDDDHRYDLDGVYDIAAENPDRWAVEELAATIDIVTRLAECLDTGDDELTDPDDDPDVDDDIELERRSGGDATRGGEFGALAELVSRPEVGSLGLGVEAFLGRSGEDAWVGVGGALDDLWEDVLEELGAHLDWTGGGTVAIEDYPSAAEADDEDDEFDDEADDTEDAAPATRPAGGSTAASAAAAGVSTIARPGRIAAPPAEVAKAAEFWEAVGILPVEVVVPEGSGVTLRCYVDDRARFLGRDGEVFLFPSPADLTRFCRGDEAHDLTEIASWPEVADTDTPPLPADQDRYDLTELTEVLAEVAGGAAGLVDHRVLAQQIDGVRDVAEYAGLTRVDELLRPDAPLGQAVARGERQPDAPLRAEDAAVLRPAWDQVVTEVSGALVFRD